MPQEVTEQEKVGLTQDTRCSWNACYCNPCYCKTFRNRGSEFLDPNSYIDGCDPLIGDRVEDMCGTDGTCAPINQVGGFRTQVEDLLTPVRKQEKVYTKYEYKTVERIPYHKLEDVLNEYGAQGFTVVQFLTIEEHNMEATVLFEREQEN